MVSNSLDNTNPTFSDPNQYIKYATNNKDFLKNAGSGICVYCKTITQYEDISEWIGSTAVCDCMVDAIIPVNILPSDAEERTKLLNIAYNKGFTYKPKHI